MQIGFVRVFVTDFQKSLEYYSKTLGMELDYTDGKIWAQFKSGAEVSLAIEACDPNYAIMGTKMVGRFTAISIMVDNLSDVYQKLTSKGVQFTGEPEKQPWGGTIAHLKDLDGNILTLMQEAS